SGLHQADVGINDNFQVAETAANEALQGIEQQAAQGTQGVSEANDSALSEFVKGIDSAFDEIRLAMDEGLTEIETKTGENLGQVSKDLAREFGQTLHSAAAEIVNAVSQGIAKNDEALGNLDPAMQKAAEDAAWEYDHPVLATLRDIVSIIAGVIVGILATARLIFAVFAAFELAFALIALTISVPIAGAVVLIAGLALLAYGVYKAYQARVAAGKKGGLGTFGLALLDLTGLTDIYRSFAAKGLSPYDRGHLFGQGLVQLAATLLMVRGAWRFVRGGGLRTAWKGLLRDVGEVGRGIGRGIRGAGRWMRRQIGRTRSTTRPFRPEIREIKPQEPNRPEIVRPRQDLRLKVTRTESNVTVEDPATRETIGLGELDSEGYVKLAIYTKEANTTIRGGEVFDAIIGEFRAGSGPVRGVRGLWYSGDNLATFNSLIRQGLTPEEAALQTFTGKMAQRSGYTRARIDYDASPQSIDGSFQKAEVYFYR
ncbi:MAG: hypothetical protein WCH39_14770, partial [Schlesneria sp.]